MLFRSSSSASTRRVCKQGQLFPKVSSASLVTVDHQPPPVADPGMLQVGGGGGGVGGT